MTENGYVELNVVIPLVNDEKREIVIALLSGLGYESFVDTPSGINAYIQSAKFSIKSVEDCGITELEALEGIDFSHRIIEKVNWNRRWESNFPQLMIAGRCSVRASFHQRPAEAEYDIVIDPKMSFGTGHHHTTSMMIELILDLDLKGKRVLDMGCGTGILAILAAKKNAASVEAVDIDEWAWKNTLENCILNGVEVNARQGSIEIVSGELYDVVLANITRNILTDNMSALNASLNNGGHLLLTGFFTRDLDDISGSANKEGLTMVKYHESEGWCAAEFLKQS
jgi:ribosomal protein L11 methyltransferase